MHEQEFRAAAWAPWADLDALEADGSARDAEVDWIRRRDVLAAAWVSERARAEGNKRVLRVPSHAHSYRERHELSPYAATAAVVTNRGGDAHGGGATLVVDGGAKEIVGGMRDADGSSICVVEHPRFPLEGWAMTLGALDLRTKRPTVDTRTPEQVDLIESLADSLYGGWSHPMGRRGATYYLPRLVDAGMSRATFDGSLLALAPERCDTAAIDKVAPPAWREEVQQRRLRGMRF